MARSDGAACLRRKVRVVVREVQLWRRDSGNPPQLQGTLRGVRERRELSINCRTPPARWESENFTPRVLKRELNKHRPRFCRRYATAIARRGLLWHRKIEFDSGGDETKVPLGKTGVTCEDARLRRNRMVHHLRR